MPKVKNFRQPPELPKLEEETLKFWEKDKTFERSVQERSEDNSYVFYDGPPFATGMPHYGHLLSSTTKDVVPRYQTMKGKRVERIWGWDCHGLPIEHMMEKKLKIKGGKKGIEDLGIDKFNQACSLEVLRLDKEWEKIVGRLGRWVDFKNNYKTMDASFMESVWWGFKQLDEKDLVYEGKKVILYCPRCSTPLSNFEIAMDNSYVDVTEESTVYKYKVEDRKDTYLLAWSTTPWNKLVTPALAVNPDLEYLKVSQEKDGKQEFYILAKETLKILDGEHEVVKKYTGKDLEKLSFEMHFNFYPDRKENERVGAIIADDFVTAEDGTGVVTLAVYGEDDYRVMKEHGIQMAEHVDEEGNLKSEVKPWAGENILEVNPKVDEDLASRGLIYKHISHHHSVATCYRCSTRLYYAPLPAWFVDIKKFKQNLIDQNEKINWVPNHLKHGRFMKGLESAPDWNVSRSRYWGTPMPIWVGENKDGKKLKRIVGSVAELREWAVDPDSLGDLKDLHREFLDDIELWVDDDRKVKGARIPEVFDCWIESGSMPFASKHYPFENKEEFEKTYPAQFVSEYIAQTRAWFYTMHVLSVGIFGKPGFENVLTTGTVLAEDGSKMSKSKKNYPDPMLLIDKYGVDSLRLYLMSSPLMKSENLSFSEKEVSDIRRKVFVVWWNVLSFYKTFAKDDSSKPELPSKQPTHVMDRWMLSRLQTLAKETTKHMDGYDLVRASRGLAEFVNELSTWYLRLSRERIKADDNAEVSQVFSYAIYLLAQLFAPVTPFFSELIHHNMVDEKSSIHLTMWPEVNADFQDEKLEEEMELMKKAVEMAHAFRRDNGLKVRQPLSEVHVSLKEKELKNKDLMEELLMQELNVKAVKWSLGADGDMVGLNTDLTPELKEEGEAREIMRKVQNLRRKAGMKVGERATAQLLEWPEKWQGEIETKTSTKLIKGDTIELV